MRDGKITVYYRSSGSTNQAQALIVKQDLLNLGFSNNNINMKPQSGGDIYTAMGKKGTDADMGVSMGWCSDYPDPYDWINILLYGPSIQAENNVNYSYFNNPKWNKRMANAAKLVGPETAQGLWPDGPRHHEEGCSDGDRADVQQQVLLLEQGQPEGSRLPGDLPGLEHPRIGPQVRRL